MPDINIKFDLTPNQIKFLEAYEDSGIVTKAARQADVSTGSHYLWLKESATYVAAFAAAEKIAQDGIREEVRRRAIDGWEEPVFYQGEQTGTVRKYSDALLVHHSKARVPEYREKTEISFQSPEAALAEAAKLMGATPDEVRLLLAERSSAKPTE